MLPSHVPPAPSTTEASRLLCAGTYLDDTFRDAVINELYVHEERRVAPSFGFDAARVLAHALRARRMAATWAALVLALWLIGIALSGGLMLAFVPPFALLAAGSRFRTASAKHPEPSPGRAAGTVALRWSGRAWLGGLALWLLWIYPGLGTRSDSLGAASQDDVFSWISGLWMGLGHRPVHWWATVCCVLLMAVAGALHRAQIAAILGRELSPQDFGEPAIDPAVRAIGIRFQRLRQLIHREQTSLLLLYDTAAPFRGAGVPYPSWTHAVSLRPNREPGFESRTPSQLLNQEVLTRIRLRMERIRTHSALGSAQDTVRDRLRQLTVDDCVFLPVDGLPHRWLAPQSLDELEAHRASAVEEGGEKRRHFLRIQVSSWDDEVVLTVYVRVHTQGGLLTLEAAPFVLRPVLSWFREADRIAHRQRHSGFLAKAAQASVRIPVTAGSAPLLLWRAAKHSWRLLVGGYEAGLPEGPAMSVRELASERRTGAFQDMDIERYLESVREGIAQGVGDALREAGWQVDEFEAKALTKGIFIGATGLQPGLQSDLSPTWQAGGGAA
ncbi:hypothetical protein [Streptomyces sp. NPDC050848]|uniref:hypothetical protein n=1 Tax=Streptomyces sp. NPDC050848 TaxID=3155791 RepID=UPI0034097F5E